MNTPLGKQQSIERLDSIIPEKTPLYIGQGVVFEGDVRFMSEDPDQRLLVVGEIKGNIFTNAVLQIAEGAVISAVESIEANEIVVSGTIKGDGVKVKANLMLLQPTGNIAVDTICLPPGGLEQSRGGILNARLDMSREHGTVPAVKPQIEAVDHTKPAVPVALKAVSTSSPASGSAAAAGLPATSTSSGSPVMMKDHNGPTPLARGASFATASANPSGTGGSTSTTDSTGNSASPSSNA